MFQEIDSPTIAEYTRQFPEASDAFYNLFLDFMDIAKPDSELAQEYIESVYKMISLITDHWIMYIVSRETIGKGLRGIYGENYAAI